MSVIKFAFKNFKLSLKWAKCYSFIDPAAKAGKVEA